MMSRMMRRMMRQIIAVMLMICFITGIVAVPVYAEEHFGNGKATEIYTTSKTKELKAVWISYLEFKSTGYTKKEFQTQITKMFNNVVAQGMNAVVVHVRPFGDAMYKSSYFPWSKYCSGTQGKYPGFDPLEIMVTEAHKRGLQFHAWINPYRVTLSNTDITTLAANNPARKWLTDKYKGNDRYILSYGGNLYYNPGSVVVRKLIRKGVKEIVQNYDVDGIHFDDYFYPTLGSNYKKLFDAPEYQKYVTDCKDKGVKNVLSIAKWRRRNVNWLIKNLYNDIKKVDSKIVFGISPGGYLDTLLMDDRYYVDIKTWMGKAGYVDYICPQIYWGFNHSIYPFDKTVKRWKALLKTNRVDLYIGIPVYKVGTTEEPEFKNNPNILVDMVNFCQNSGSVSGYMFYRYDYFYRSITKKAVKLLIDKLSQS